MVIRILGVVEREDLTCTLTSERPHPLLTGVLLGFEMYLVVVGLVPVRRLRVAVVYVWIDGGLWIRIVEYYWWRRNVIWLEVVLLGFLSLSLSFDGLFQRVMIEKYVAWSATVWC